MHLQSGSKSFYCSCNCLGWSHFHCSTTFFPTVCLNPGQKQLSVLPVWHIHTPATDRPPLLLRCPRSRHRQSATHHYGSLPRGLRTGFCHQQDESQRRMEECLSVETKQIPQQCTIYFTSNLVNCGNHAYCCPRHYSEQCICKKEFPPLVHL